MRIASFNLESLDVPSKARVPLEVRPRSFGRPCNASKPTCCSGLADVHKLVTLSRFPIRAHEEVRHGFIAVAGDFNAEDHEVPLKLIVAAEENTGNPLLAQRSWLFLTALCPRIAAGVSSITVAGRCSTIFSQASRCTDASAPLKSTTKRSATSSTAMGVTCAPRDPRTHPS
jgi:hypothetical protein